MLWMLIPTADKKYVDFLLELSRIFNQYIFLKGDNLNTNNFHLSGLYFFE